MIGKSDQHGSKRTLNPFDVHTKQFIPTLYLLHGLRYAIAQAVQNWRCRLCPHHPKQYACGSTKHPIEHLRTHRLTDKGPIEAESSNSIIRQAFGNRYDSVQSIVQEAV